MNVAQRSSLLGFSDIVRIRNGEIAYWPNLGYGRFGTKVSMDGSPWFDHPDRYDPRRHGRYRDADQGYRRDYGPRGVYEVSYRRGFERGYDEGYADGQRRRW